MTGSHRPRAAARGVQIKDERSVPELSLAGKDHPGCAHDDPVSGRLAREPHHEDRQGNGRVPEAAGEVKTDGGEEIKKVQRTGAACLLYWTS